MRKEFDRQEKEREKGLKEYGRKYIPHESSSNSYDHKGSKKKEKKSKERRRDKS